jgi:solute carrier family 35 (UDP-sugar transporter), member A1/2/3
MTTWRLGVLSWFSILVAVSTSIKSPTDIGMVVGAYESRQQNLSIRSSSTHRHDERSNMSSLNNNPGDSKGPSVSSAPPSGNLQITSGASADNDNKGAKANAAAMNSFKLLLLVMMVAQNSATVLVGRYTRSGVPKDQLYEVNHLILVCEVGKLILSCILEFKITNGKLWRSVETHILKRPMDALKILVPALLYLVQNTLLYVALSNLTAPLFQVTYQAKLVTTAIVSVLMLNRSYNTQQWICLCAISVGVAIVVLGEKKDDPNKTLDLDKAPQNLVTGLIAVTIACMSSALAGVYFEKVLKKADNSRDSGKEAVEEPSLWMRNLQLSFFSIVIAYLQGVYDSTFPRDAEAAALAASRPYLHGFSFWTWILVFLQAGGGMLVAAVIKYADNVLKGLATGVSVVVATAFSMILFDTPLTGQFGVGAVLILTAVYLFSNPLPAQVTTFLKRIQGKNEEEETRNLLPT